MKNCIICGKPTTNSKYCKHCGNKNRNAQAVVAQNVSKLKILLGKKRDAKWFDKFVLYVNNIIENMPCILESNMNSMLQCWDTLIA